MSTDSLDFSFQNNQNKTGWIVICCLLGVIGAIIFGVIIAWIIKVNKENYEARNDPKINELREHFTLFWNKPRKWPHELSYLKNRDIMGEVTLQRGDKSYTINKQHIYMCLRDENGEYYPFNMLVYVLAHEFAHVISTSIGHTPEFHQKFDMLLDTMIKEGYYDASEEIILDYCNHS
jgi:hypothetical protein